MGIEEMFWEKNFSGRSPTRETHPQDALSLLACCPHPLSGSNIPLHR